MSNTATINRGGDLLSLTAQRGGTVLVSLHSVNPAGHLTGLSVPGAQLRAALDEVAPAGSYTRTDEDWKARAEKAERERDEWKDSAIKAMADLERAEQPRPLTDEMIERARRAWNRSAALGDDLWRDVLTAAIGPARPEGAEEIEALIETSPWHLAGSCASEADWLAERGVRVVTEEQP